MMKLHWSPRSPYVRKVLVFAHEVGVADRLAPVRTLVGGTIIHRELMAENPLGKIPTLVLEDGAILYDSLVICEYLDTLHVGQRLIPADWPSRAVALRRHALGHGMLDAGLLWLGERSRPADRRSDAHTALWQAKIAQCVAALEHENLASSRVTIGEIAIGVALSYLDFRFAAERWRDLHPRLAAWYAAFEQRGSMQVTAFVDDS